MTLQQLIDQLETAYPADAQVVIRDADTDWIGDKIHHEWNKKGRVELFIEYPEMSSKA